jgi:hypothetical protein
MRPGYFVLVSLAYLPVALQFFVGTVVVHSKNHPLIVSDYVIRIELRLAQLGHKPLFGLKEKKIQHNVP